MPSLTRTEAATRAEVLRVHEYRIDLDVTGTDRFRSTTTVRFGCAQPGTATFVELKGAESVEASLNGRPLAEAALADDRLTLTDLAAENELVVTAELPYSNTGEGLHRFVDPEDGAVYLCLTSFLDDGQRVFACFDQPDLKAPVTLLVTAPPEWIVVGNAPLARAEGGRWEFEPTEPISTYLVSLIAGPYHGRHDEHDGVPLAIYCRQSLAEHLDKDAAEIFDITRACLDRYHELFDLRYPFQKYDQAFVPEFNAGAMENPGLVTFAEEFVHRSAVTDAERELRAAVIAHEMAHMWFGDLVTMRWWDDLWLNESFAEYMGYRVTAEVTRHTEAWTSFAVGRKGWGYSSDQRPSTHPVAPAEVADTAEALLNFDGISYAKGASVLRQLVAWVGDDAFIAGLRAHFRTHAFGNATLADLLDALSTASGMDLDSWAEVWLRRAYVNTLVPVATVGPDGRYSDVVVEQTAPAEYPTLRPHRLGIGVYAPKNGTVERRAQVEVVLEPTLDNGRTPVPSLVGVEAGGLILVNDGDLTFAKARLDAAGRAAVPAILPALTDSLARALLWASAADATRDAEMPAGEFVDLCVAGLPAETQLAVFDDVLRFAAGIVVPRFLPASERSSGYRKLAETSREILAAAEPGSGRQLAAARGLVWTAGPDDVAEMRAWLDGSVVPQGLAIDAELRWAVLRRLVVLDAAGAVEIAAEQERDPSARGAENAVRCRAAIPDPAAKADAWTAIVADDSLSNRLVTAAASGFWHAEQVELTRSYVDRYFAEMPEVSIRRTPQVVYSLASAAYPAVVVEPATVAAARRMLAGNGLSPMLRRVAVDSTDELERALAARALAGGDPAEGATREGAAVEGAAVGGAA